MTYTITAEDIRSITDVEAAFSTSRLLPSPEQIPKDFYEENSYTRLVEAIFYGLELPNGELELAEGLEPSELNKCVRAHLQSFEPKHEHKIAGVAYMISQVAVLTLNSGQ